MHAHVIRAIFRRNFLSYFNNPTGYVFICLFVILGSLAAFWPNEFFNANLANLDQLNRWLPYLLLVFVPTITMSIWSEERRQGTDELLLTIPAADIDVVLGKYLAAVAVYSVSLLFSAICNFLVLRALGSPDVLLFLSNYLGYWLVGLAMLATGMVASFLTNNLTVAFILGLVFNGPLVFADWADSITGTPEWALAFKRWGIPEQFRDFGRGVVSLSATCYFLTIAAVMLYLCLVLIGRRHWRGGRDGQSMLGHYLVRALALAAIAIAADMIVESIDLRKDVTAEQVSSLLPQTIDLVQKLDTKNRPVVIEAFISPSVPENYVQTRLSLLNALREFEKIGRGKIQMKIVNAEPDTNEATRAEQVYNIRAQTVFGRSRGAMRDEKILLGVAVKCGTEKVVIPFFDRGMSVEYELARSVATVGQKKRKRLGVVTTDAQLFGGFDFQSMQSMGMKPRQPIIEELEKQYEVVQVDPSKPIEKFDALLAVQPSSLGPPQLSNLVDAIRAGQATAVFEDPMPGLMQGVPGTSEPKQQGGPMGQMGQPSQKGDIQQLWDLLGVRMVSKERQSPFGPATPQAEVIWQRWNPYPMLDQISGMYAEYVFIGRNAKSGGTKFNDDDPITSHLQEMWFPFPGAFSKLNATNMKVVELVQTGVKTGQISPEQFKQAGSNTARREAIEDENETGKQYMLAAHITGDVKAAEPPPDASSDAEKEKDAGKNKDAGKKNDANKDKDDKKDAAKGADTPAGGSKSAAAEEAAKRRAAQKSKQINVVLVGDIDLMDAGVFRLRAGGEDEDFGVRFDNVVFVLNAIDSLAGDDRFIAIRKHRPEYRKLTTIENRNDDFRQGVIDELDKARKDLAVDKKQEEERRDEVSKKFAELKKKALELRDQGLEIPASLIAEAGEAQRNYEVEQVRAKVREEQLDQKLQHKVEQLKRELNSDIRNEQNFYKLIAVIFPPILPAVVAVFVFFGRRAEEREGVAKSRLR